MRVFSQLLAIAAIMSMATMAHAQLTWDEAADGGGDAGDFPAGTFQTTAGGEMYNMLTGNNAGDIDAYEFTVTDAPNFFIEDQGGNDTQSFTFNTDGSPLFANDDNPSGAFGFSFGFGDANSHTGIIIGAPGTVTNGSSYVLCIGGFGDTANGSGGGTVFEDDGGDFSALVGPTGQDFVSWNAGAGPGAYSLVMTGAHFGTAGGGGGFVPPSSYTVFRGNELSGARGDFAESDDVKASYNPGFTINSLEAPVWLVFDATAGGATAFRCESSAGTPGLEYTAEAWNWNTHSYDVIGVQAEAFNTDQIVEFNITPADHIDSTTNAVRGRVGWRKAGFTINFPWTANVDQCGWVQ